MGLICQCDREGRFRWRPDILKLDVLPWDDLDFEEVLGMLCRASMVVKYEVNGESYGCIPTFKRHQVINPKEAKSRLPEPNSPELQCNSPELPNDPFEFTKKNVVEGKGMEGKGIERKGKEVEWKGSKKTEIPEETHVSISEIQDPETQKAQAKLIEARTRQGLNPDGTSAQAWNEARGD